ncbi:hypothetical protein GGR54DRAFT_329245 [Hypoxylon sp. NC1633]|nr:hypothetical protein GGR54DRAFT_329245 [Hypoxylon sp. NC1633]
MDQSSGSGDLEPQGELSLANVAHKSASSKPNEPHQPRAHLEAQPATSEKMAPQVKDNKKKGHSSGSSQGSSSSSRGITPSSAPVTFRSQTLQAIQAARQPENTRDAVAETTASSEEDKKTIANLQTKVAAFEATIAALTIEVSNKVTEVIQERSAGFTKDFENAALGARIGELEGKLKLVGDGENAHRHEIAAKDDKIAQLGLQIAELRDAMHSGLISVANLYGPDATFTFTRFAEGFAAATERNSSSYSGPYSVDSDEAASQADNKTEEARRSVEGDQRPIEKGKDAAEEEKKPVEKAEPQAEEVRPQAKEAKSQVHQAELQAEHPKDPATSPQIRIIVAGPSVEEGEKPINAEPPIKAHASPADVVKLAVETATHMLGPQDVLPVKKPSSQSLGKKLKIPTEEPEQAASEAKPAIDKPEEHIDEHERVAERREGIAEAKSPAETVDRPAEIAKSPTETIKASTETIKAPAVTVKSPALTTEGNEKVKRFIDNARVNMPKKPTSNVEQPVEQPVSNVNEQVGHSEGQNRSPMNQDDKIGEAEVVTLAKAYSHVQVQFTRATEDPRPTEADNSAEQHSKPQEDKEVTSAAPKATASTRPAGKTSHHPKTRNEEVRVPLCNDLQKTPVSPHALPIQPYDKGNLNARARPAYADVASGSITPTRPASLASAPKTERRADSPTPTHVDSVKGTDVPSSQEARTAKPKMNNEEDEDGKGDGWTQVQSKPKPKPKPKPKFKKAKFGARPTSWPQKGPNQAQGRNSVQRQHKGTVIGSNTTYSQIPAQGMREETQLSPAAVNQQQNGGQPSQTMTDPPRGPANNTNGFLHRRSKKRRSWKGATSNQQQKQGQQSSTQETGRSQPKDGKQGIAGQNPASKQGFPQKAVVSKKRLEEDWPALPSSKKSPSQDAAAIGKEQKGSQPGPTSKQGPSQGVVSVNKKQKEAQPSLAPKQGSSQGVASVNKKQKEAQPLPAPKQGSPQVPAPVNEQQEAQPGSASKQGPAQDATAPKKQQKQAQAEPTSKTSLSQATDSKNENAGSDPASEQGSTQDAAAREQQEDAQAEPTSTTSPSQVAAAVNLQQEEARPDLASEKSPSQDTAVVEEQQEATAQADLPPQEDHSQAAENEQKDVEDDDTAPKEPDDGSSPKESDGGSSPTEPDGGNTHTDPNVASSPNGTDDTPDVSSSRQATTGLPSEGAEVKLNWADLNEEGLAEAGRTEQGTF